MRGALWCLGGIALARADEDEFDSVVREMSKLPNDHYRLMLLADHLLEQGQLDEARRIANEPIFDPRPGARGWQSARTARILWYQGHKDEAREAFEVCRQLGLASDVADVADVADELLWLLSDEDDLRAAYSHLRRTSVPALWGGGGMVTDWAKLTPLGKALDRIRGDFAFHLDLVDEAEQHLRVGLEWCERERCLIEAGRCLQGLAEVAERRGDLDAAREHLGGAAAKFADHGAKLYLDQVLAKKEFLKA